MAGNMAATDVIVQLFEQRGADRYGGEAISQIEHALQTAHLAVSHDAADALVVAALLHDVGHLLHTMPDDVAGFGIDMRHEELGTDWLSTYFGPEVTAPIRLHVAAKRYLCATDSEYAGRLSPASRQSLFLQGGPMSASEVAAFELVPNWDQAVLLRAWDDEAKVPDLVVPSLASYRRRLEGALRRKVRA
jgi:phosphonate degradation associated HDIG domain protein